MRINLFYSLSKYRTYLRLKGNWKIQVKKMKVKMANNGSPFTGFIDFTFYICNWFLIFNWSKKMLLIFQCIIHSKLAFFKFNFIIAYYSIKACGKRITRHVGITYVMLISITNFILTGIFISSPYYNQGLMISLLVKQSSISN